MIKIVHFGLFKQIQASIAQTFQRQTEALGRKRTPKSTSALRRSHGRYRDTPLRGRRNYRMTELQGSDENDDANGDAGKDSSSADERSTEVRPKRRKRWYGARFSQSSSAAAGIDGGGDENDSEVHRESMGASVGLIGPSERLAWGKGGIRSHTRHGSVSGSNGKNARNNRLSKLVDYLQSLEEKDDQVRLLFFLVYDTVATLVIKNHDFHKWLPKLSELNPKLLFSFFFSQCKYSSQLLYEHQIHEIIIRHCFLES